MRPSGAARQPNPELLLTGSFRNAPCSLRSLVCKYTQIPADRVSCDRAESGRHTREAAAPPWSSPARVRRRAVDAGLLDKDFELAFGVAASSESRSNAADCKARRTPCVFRDRCRHYRVVRWRRGPCYIAGHNTQRKSDGRHSGRPSGDSATPTWAIGRADCGGENKRRCTDRLCGRLDIRGALGRLRRCIRNGDGSHPRKVSHHSARRWSQRRRVGICSASRHSKRRHDDK